MIFAYYITPMRKIILLFIPALFALIACHKSNNASSPPAPEQVKTIREYIAEIPGTYNFQVTTYSNCGTCVPLEDTVYPVDFIDNTLLLYNDTTVYVKSSMPYSPKSIELMRFQYQDTQKKFLFFENNDTMTHIQTYYYYETKTIVTTSHYENSGVPGGTVRLTYISI